jgi:crossover junction endodeoxyribonuclease RuvC
MTNQDPSQKEETLLGPIMGLDPGSLHAGYGLVNNVGSKITLLTQGRVSAPGSWDFPKRLAHIHRGLLEIVDHYKPRALAIEDVFTMKFPRQALKLAQARGVAILAASLREIPVFEYAPSQIKSAVTGYGQAEKTQVAYMVKSILGQDLDLPPDASDALAAAICHANQKTLLRATGGSKPKSAKWSQLSPDDLLAMGFKVAKS